MEKNYKKSKQYLKDLGLQDERDPLYKIFDEPELRQQDFAERALILVKSPYLLVSQQETLMTFLRYCKSKGSPKPVTYYNYVLSLKSFGEVVKKPFLEVNRDDVEDYFLNIKRVQKSKNMYKPLKERSIICKNVTLKVFYKWLYLREKIEFKGDFPELVIDLNTKVPRKTLQTSELLTKREIRKLIEACYKKRDKAIISTLYETGCRASELCFLKIKDIKVETHSIDVNIRISKTTPRTIILINSYLYLLDYLNEHPYKDDPEAPLFINISNAHFGRSILYQGLNSIVRTAKKRAKINKKITLHLFRHSRATEMASKGWTEAQLRKWFGWSETSGTPTIYVHIGTADIKKKILKEHGLLSENESVDEMNERIALEPKECFSCGNMNPPDALACHCGRALTYESVKEIKELKDKTDNYMNKINSLPLRANIVEDGMSSLDYKRKLINSDPFLKEEFEKVAKKIMDKVKVKEEFEKPNNSKGVLTKKTLREKYKDEVLELRKRGWPMEAIAKEVGLGYGTVNLICNS